MNTQLTALNNEAELGQQANSVRVWKDGAHVRRAPAIGALWLPCPAKLDSRRELRSGGNIKAHDYKPWKVEVEGPRKRTYPRNVPSLPLFTVYFDASVSPIILFNSRNLLLLGHNRWILSTVQICYFPSVLFFSSLACHFSSSDSEKYFSISNCFILSVILSNFSLIRAVMCIWPDKIILI
jgi:hypothetical protein